MEEPLDRSRSLGIAGRDELGEEASTKLKARGISHIFQLDRQTFLVLTPTAFLSGSGPRAPEPHDQRTNLIAPISLLLLPPPPPPPSCSSSSSPPPPSSLCSTLPRVLRSASPIVISRPKTRISISTLSPDRHHLHTLYSRRHPPFNNPGLVCASRRVTSGLVENQNRSDPLKKFPGFTGEKLPSVRVGYFCKSNRNYYCFYRARRGLG